MFSTRLIINILGLSTTNVRKIFHSPGIFYFILPFYYCFYCNLCFAVFYYYKPKTENNAFDILVCKMANNSKKL